ncbi:MAG: hypothetical protein ACR2PL_12650 [Dehalococcoidia bacterium]
MEHGGQAGHEAILGGVVELPRGQAVPPAGTEGEQISPLDALGHPLPRELQQPSCFGSTQRVRQQGIARCPRTRRHRCRRSCGFAMAHTFRVFELLYNERA